MTTKIITPAEVTMEMLRSGVESNETAENWPARFQLVGSEVQYSVKGRDGWKQIDIVTLLKAVQLQMKDNSDADTIWTTTVEQETA